MGKFIILVIIGFILILRALYIKNKQRKKNFMTIEDLSSVMTIEDLKTERKNKIMNIRDL